MCGWHGSMTKIRPHIHWVSPLPPAETDIAHYTGRILPDLCAQADVTLWSDTTGWDPALRQFCPVRHLDPDRAQPDDLRVAGAKPGQPEIMILHIGNSWVHHSGLLRLARRMPTIIVLHDLAIQEMLKDSIIHDRFDPDVYQQDMAHWYGEQGADWAEQVLNHSLHPGALATTAPGFELALTQALGVIVHAPVAAQAVRDRTSLPCHQLELPFQAGPERSAKRSDIGPLRLAQFGYIGPNRRIEQILQALAGLEDEVDFTFDIFGKLWNPDLIKGQIADLGLGDRVRIQGFVDEPILDEVLSRMHLVFNLRHPTMGEASGSQLRIWNASAAAVVTDQGWYQDLPDDTVFRVPIEGDVEAIQALIRRLNADRSLGEQIGAAGRARLMALHQPDRYATQIADIARQAPQMARDALFARAADRLGVDQDETGLLRKRSAALR